MISIYHSLNTRQSAFYDEDTDVTEIFEQIANNGYQLMGTVDAADLEGAWKASQNINEAWITAEGANADPMTDVKRVRSSMVGDIFGFNGELHVVGPFGFFPLRK